MAIRFECSNCAKTLRAPEKLAGKLAKCPDCGTKTRVPKPSKQKAAVSSGGADDPGFEIVEEATPTPEVTSKPGSKAKPKEKKKLRECPECEEKIPETAVVCRFCGERFDLASKDQRSRAADAARIKKRGQSGGAVMALFAIVLIAIAGGAIYYFAM